jgi:hypothetical protein
MSLTVREAIDVQIVAAWASTLTTWDTDPGLVLDDDETDVAEALLRLVNASADRLRGTGQGRGVTGPSLAQSHAITRMVLHGGDGS